MCLDSSSPGFIMNEDRAVQMLTGALINNNNKYV